MYSSSICVVFALNYLYMAWKKSELSRLRRKAHSLLKHGYVMLNCYHRRPKRYIWDRILKPRLECFWEKKYSDFKLCNRNTWPKVNQAFCEVIPGLPQLYSDNYEVQALLCFLLDSNLRCFHFGEQTHWKLKLLISPFWFVFGEIFCSINAASLHGADQSPWHLLNWPDQENQVGESIPKTSHFDNGHMDMYEKGLPTAADNPFSSLQHRMLSMLLWQCSVLLYSDTPGDLSSAEGVTGLFPSSHFAMLDAIHTLAAQNIATTMTPDAVTYSIRRDKFRESLKDWGDERNPVQLPISEGEMLLILPTLVHCGMKAMKPMENGMPRVIQNPKSYASVYWLSTPENQRKFVALLDSCAKTSLFHRLYTDALGLCGELWSEDDSNMMCKCKKDSEELVQRILSS